MNEDKYWNCSSYNVFLCFCEVDPLTAFSFSLIFLHWTCDVPPCFCVWWTDSCRAAAPAAQTPTNHLFHISSETGRLMIWLVVPRLLRYSNVRQPDWWNVFHAVNLLIIINLLSARCSVPDIYKANKQTVHMNTGIDQSHAGKPVICIGWSAVI